MPRGMLHSSLPRLVNSPEDLKYSRPIVAVSRPRTPVISVINCRPTRRNGVRELHASSRLYSQTRHGPGRDGIPRGKVIGAKEVAATNERDEMEDGLELLVMPCLGPLCGLPAKSPKPRTTSTQNCSKSLPQRPPPSFFLVLARPRELTLDQTTLFAAASAYLLLRCLSLSILAGSGHAPFVLHFHRPSSQTGRRQRSTSERQLIDWLLTKRIFKARAYATEALPSTESLNGQANDGRGDLQRRHEHEESLEEAGPGCDAWANGLHDAVIRYQVIQRHRK